MKKVVVMALMVAGCAAIPLVAGRLQQRHFDGKTWWEYVKVLADDKMEGRETGSEGLRRAQAYVVDRLKNAGLEPAGTDGFYQPVAFRSRRIIEKDSSAALVRNGKREPLVLGEDAFFNTRVDLAPEVRAPLVFVGYGLTVPEANYDDLAGLDLKGKVAVVFAGAPEGIPAALASHYQFAGERWKLYRNAGIVGIISIPNPAAMDTPWPRMSLNRARPSMDLADPTLNETVGQKLGMTFNPARADKLFAGTGHAMDEIASLGKARKPLPRFPLLVSIEARTKVEITNVASANVVAKLPGSDPRLEGEHVVLAAHLDHLGLGEPINGDRNYNGAMDNAAGCALLLDVAASLKQSRERLGRSVLFVFATAEEQGLLGSNYFAAHPTVDPKSIVAAINTDMFLPIMPLKILTVLGLQESDMGDIAREAAQALGLPVRADPEPERNRFIRSDQYSFIRRGVPSVAMKVGFDPGSPEQKIISSWLTERYHAPSDDLDQPVDFSAAARFEEVVRGMTVSLANRAERPQWKPASFFRRYAVTASGR
jgi:Zn-dependent M28 family amino/carboxypeptidase